MITRSFLKCSISNNLDGTEIEGITIKGTPGYRLPEPEKEFELDDSSSDGDDDDEIITEGEMDHSEDDESEDEE